MGRVISLVKFAAIILVAAGCTVGGMLISCYHSRRADILSTLILMITVIENQLRYTCLPVADLLRVLCENPAFSELGFIKCTREKMCFGEPFPDAWRESVETESELCGVLSSAARHLAALGSDIGSTDLEGQLSCCEYYKNIFAVELENQQEKCRKYSKLFPPLGLLLGISAAIFMI